MEIAVTEVPETGWQRYGPLGGKANRPKGNAHWVYRRSQTPAPGFTQAQGRAKGLRPHGLHVRSRWPSRSPCDERWTSTLPAVVQRAKDKWADSVGSSGLSLAAILGRGTIPSIRWAALVLPAGLPNRPANGACLPHGRASYRDVPLAVAASLYEHGQPLIPRASRALRDARDATQYAGIARF